MTKGLFFIYAYSCENAQHHSIIKATRWRYLSFEYRYQACRSGYSSQGVGSTTSEQAGPYLDLMGVALIFLPGPYFCVGGCGFVFRGCAWGRQSLSQDLSFQSMPVFGSLVHACLWVSCAMCLSSSLLLTMYLSHFLFLRIFRSLPHVMSSLSPLSSFL